MHEPQVARSAREVLDARTEGEREGPLERARRHGPSTVLSLALHMLAVAVPLTFGMGSPGAGTFPVRASIRPEPERPRVEDTTPPVGGDRGAVAAEPVAFRRPQPVDDVAFVAPRDLGCDFTCCCCCEALPAPEWPDVGAAASARLDAVGADALPDADTGVGQDGAERFGGRRNLRGGCSTKSSEGNVLHALEWLAAHQSGDGRWDADGFDAGCGDAGCSGAGAASHDVGVTGLSLLCFLGAGETHNSGPNKDTVARGLAYLKSVQDADGCFGPRTSRRFQYDHLCASLALTEAYGLTGSRLFEGSAQRAVAFVEASRNPYLAWRYGVRDGGNDTSVTGWAVMVLESARLAQLDVDSRSMEGAVTWIDRMTEPDLGRVGYERRGGASSRLPSARDAFPARNVETMSAVGVLARIFAGRDPATTPEIAKGADVLARAPPVRGAGTNDFCYWYLGTLAQFQVGGERWRAWNESMKEVWMDSQHTDGHARGSWDPVDAWSSEGGRVYATALGCLCLEAYYRYGRVFGTHAR